MNFGIQLIPGQKGGDCDGTKEEACQRVEMIQRLLRPEDLWPRVRSDLSWSSKSHPTHNIDQLPSSPSHPASECASTPASCSTFFTVWNSASPQVIHGFFYGKGAMRCSYLNNIILLLLLHLPSKRQVEQNHEGYPQKYFDWKHNPFLKKRTIKVWK